MSFRSFVLTLPAVAVAFVASSALAQEPAPALAPAPASASEAPSDDFGRAGQFALSLNHGFMVNESDLLGGATEIQATYFAMPHLSLGLAVGAQYVSSSPPAGGDGEHDVILHVGPRIGYDLRLGDKVSFWPQVGVDYRRYDQTSSSSAVAGSPATPAMSTSTDTTSAFGITVIAPVVLHPTSGFFLGAGPAFYTDLSNSESSGGTSKDNNKVTSIGLVATIGGSF
jgi:hypothetical protein